MIILDSVELSQEDFDKKLQESLEQGIKLKETAPGSGIYKTLKKLRD